MSHVIFHQRPPQGAQLDPPKCVLAFHRQLGTSARPSFNHRMAHPTLWSASHFSAFDLEVSLAFHFSLLGFQDSKKKGATFCGAIKGFGITKRTGTKWAMHIEFSFRVFHTPVPSSLQQSSFPPMAPFDPSRDQAQNHPSCLFSGAKPCFLLFFFLPWLLQPLVQNPAG